MLMDQIVGVRIIREFKTRMTLLDLLILTRSDASTKDTIRLAMASSDSRNVAFRRNILLSPTVMENFS